MTDQNPITPPPELVREWHQSAAGIHFHPYGYSEYIATQAAQWGAEQERDAICDWLDHGQTGHLIHPLLCARCPKPPSLKEQAFGALGRFNSNAHTRADEMTKDFDLLRRALEQLDD